MKITRLLTGLLLGPLCAAPLLADDTEIYTNPDTGDSTSPTLVMFSLDYRANLTRTICSGIGSAPEYVGCPQARYFADNGLTDDLPAGTLDQFDLLQLALKLVLQKVSGEEFKVGLMLNHNHEDNCAGPDATHCSNGGVILMGFQSLDATHAAATIDTFQAKLAALKALKPDPSSPDHSYQGKELFFELYRYLTGQAVYNGHNGWTDFEQGNGKDTDTNMRCNNADATLSPACWDAGIELGGNYISPLDSAGGCTSIYTVNLLFQGSQRENDSDDAIGDPESIGGTGAARAAFPSMIGYLHDADLSDAIAGTQNVVSYFLVAANHINTTTNAYADAGGTENAIALSEDAQELVETLTWILNETLSVSTTFVAASVPVDVFNRAKIVDNVYIALFQPEADNFWPGNLKKLKVKRSTQGDGAVSIRLVDASTTPIDALASDGRIKHRALTYWTNAAALPAAGATAADDDVDGKDGRTVERGGAGQKIPGFLDNNPGLLNSGTGARQLFTGPDSMTNGTATALRALNANATTATALRGYFSAGTSADQALDSIEWLRGLNPTDGSMRSWLLADALHSRPVAINYGARGDYSAANPDIRILMGGNDGFMHMFRNTGTDGAELGTEDWAFIPLALLDVAETLSDATATGHPYGADGAAAVWVQDADHDGTVESGDRVYAYFGLRRGGSNYYALDLSDPDADPQLLWRVGPQTGGDYADLGLTFATPGIGRVQYGSTTTTVVIVTGGYDAAKDTGTAGVPVLGSDDDTGAALYVLSAKDGSIVKKFTHPDLVDSAPGDATAVDSNGDGLIDRVYFGDTGGRIWRADLPASTRDNRGQWALTLLADLGRHLNADVANDRRFFHAIDVVQSTDAAGNFDAVIAISGDRANPRATSTENYAFVIKDRDTTSIPSATFTPITAADLGDVTELSERCMAAESSACSLPDRQYGWKLHLEEAGEKGLASPVTINNVLFFSTYLPNADSSVAPCSPSEGGGRLYAVKLSNGLAAFNYNAADDSGGGASGASDTRTTDDRYFTLLSGGIPAPVLRLGDGKLLTSGYQVIDSGDQGNLSTFWYQIEDPAAPN